jgi:hypothetical protein
MTKIVLLNNRDHHDLRLASPAVGNRHFVQIVASEFAVAATFCPVIFSKDADNGRFLAGAMLGFKEGENLLDGDAMAAGFRPLDIVRNGFFIADDQLAIDADNPRFASGQPMFESDGTPAEALREVQHAIGRFKLGLDETDAFIDVCLSLKLIEPIDITLRFDDGERINLAGVYTISLDALRELGDEDALRLFRNGWMQLAYIMANSLKQISTLAARRNRTLVQER